MNDKDETIKPNITKASLLDMQVCVPKEWDDAEVEAFAERENPCGTQAGWQIRKEGHPRLSGDPERVSCDERPNYVHIMLEA